MMMQGTSLEERVVGVRGIVVYMCWGRQLDDGLDG